MGNNALRDNLTAKKVAFLQTEKEQLLSVIEQQKHQINILKEACVYLG